MAKRQPPKESYILKLYRERKKHFEADDAEIEDMRLLRQQRKDVGLDPDYRIADSAGDAQRADIAEECERVIGMLSYGGTPEVEVRAQKGRELTEDAKKNATKREYWAQEVLRKAAEQNPGGDAITAAIDSCVADGGVWIKHFFDRQLWPTRYSKRLKQYEADTEEDDDEDTDYEAEGRPRRKKKAADVDAFNRDTEDAKKKDGVPFSLIIPDVKSVYPVWYGNKLGEMLEVQERPLNTALEEFQLGLDREGEFNPALYGQDQAEDATGQGGPGEKALFCEHWTDEWCTQVLVRGYDRGENAKVHKIKQWRHLQGKVPYEPAMGHWWSWFKNRKIGLGVASIMRATVEQLNHDLTLLRQVMYRDAMPPFQEMIGDTASSLIGNTGNATGDEVVKWSAREIRKTRGEIRAIPMPPVTEALLKCIDVNLRTVEGLKTPKPGPTLGTDLSGAGFATSQVLGEIKVKHDVYQRSIQRALVNIVKHFEDLVASRIKETVWVYADRGDDDENGGWIGLSPKDTEMGVNTYVHLNPDRPSAALIEWRLRHERLEAGTMSLDDALEEAGENAEEVRERILLDSVRKSEWFQTEMLKRIQQKAGRGTAEAEAISSMLIQQQAGVNAMGMPGAGASTPAVPGMIPDFTSLAISPGGAGANPGPVPGQGMGPGNGSVVGSSPGAVVPTQSAAPLMTA